MIFSAGVSDIEFTVFEPIDDVTNKRIMEADIDKIAKFGKQLQKSL